MPTDAYIQTRCSNPECRREYRAKAEFTGKTVKCKACGNSFVVNGEPLPIKLHPARPSGETVANPPSVSAATESTLKGPTVGNLSDQPATKFLKYKLSIILAAALCIAAIVLVALFPPWQNESIVDYMGCSRNTAFISSGPAVKLSATHFGSFRIATDWHIDWLRYLLELASAALAGLSILVVSAGIAQRIGRSLAYVWATVGVAAVGLCAVMLYRWDRNESRCVANLRAVSQACFTYANENHDALPDNMEQLVSYLPHGQSDLVCPLAQATVGHSYILKAKGKLGGADIGFSFDTASGGLGLRPRGPRVIVEESCAAHGQRPLCVFDDGAVGKTRADWDGVTYIVSGGKKGIERLCFVISEKSR